MHKYINFSLLTLAFALAGSAAAYAQPADDGGQDLADYVTAERVNFREGPDTESAVIEVLNAGTPVRVEELDEGEDGDGWGKALRDGVSGYIKAEYLLTPDEYEKLPASKLELLEWKDAKRAVSIGADLKILDVWSGLTYYVRSFSNGNHADVEPVSKEDTAVLKRTYGGSWSWDPRPVWVFADGRVIAASINGMPHGGGVNGGNGMNGQICLHFKGSTVHNGNRRYAADMQNAVMSAWHAK
jgi:hypothetical protein